MKTLSLKAALAAAILALSLAACTSDARVVEPTVAPAINAS